MMYVTFSYSKVKTKMEKNCGTYVIDFIAYATDFVARPTRFEAQATKFVVHGKLISTPLLL